MELERARDEQWAVVSRATQLEVRWRGERPGRLRLWTAIWMVRAGLRMADPLTVERLLSPPGP